MLLLLLSSGALSLMPKEGWKTRFTKETGMIGPQAARQITCTSVGACASEAAAECEADGPERCFSFGISPGWRDGMAAQLYREGSDSAVDSQGWSLWSLGASAPVKVEWLTPNIVMKKDGTGWAPVPPVPQGAGFGPIPPVDDAWRLNTSTVTVLIAALRETRCGKTLQSLFGKANYPERVFVGIVQQNAAGDVDCLDEYCELVKASGDTNCRFRKHVRMKRLMDTEAAGPVYARALQRELVEPSDDFCVQIDAHTEGIEGWDNKFLNEWGATNNEFAVLSTYPTNIDDLYKNSNNHWEMPHLCCAQLGGMGAIRNCQAKAAANLEKPILAPLWAAGMSFSRCHAERDVPNDINLRHIFTGEEFGRGVRLWTHGYDFYSITRPIIGVYYGGAKGGKGGWVNDATEMKASYQRLGTLLEWPNSDQSEAAKRKMKGYEIGKRRSLKMYLDLNHVDFEHNSMSSPCIVPWKDWLPGERDIYERAHPRAPKYAQKTAATVARAALRASSKSRGSPAVASRRVAAVPSVRTARFASATPPATLAQVEAGEGLDPSVTLLLVAIALLIASSLCLWVCQRLTGPNAREDKRVS